jgi:hypothetical protein
MKRTLPNDGGEQEQGFSGGGLTDRKNSFEMMHKRFSSGSSSGSSGASTTTGAFDWAELGSCLKRVKISVSSPGEIRLSTDLEHLNHQCGWSKKLYRDGEHWHFYQHPTKRLFLTRDPVDLLRLKLILYDGEDGEEYTFYMQFPRMYPHSPPEIYQLSLKDDDFRTYQYRDWTPIRRLHDLIEWLIALPQLQCTGEDEIMIDNEYQAQQQQQHFINCTTTIQSNNGKSTLFETDHASLNSNSNMNTNIVKLAVKQPKQQYQQYSYSDTFTEAKRDLWIFNQSRFDVGFVPLMPPPPLNPQQEAEMM